MGQGKQVRSYNDFYVKSVRLNLGRNNNDQINNQFYIGLG